ncbi:MAG TPA: type IX secretion system sortase PorU, partial [Cyclobacteriaceae bacterium]|nr:type IX secretion system sortase PorU [Cyclobacteriaceae bacterium]
DFNLHQGDANELAEFVDTNHGDFNTRKIFLDNYPQQSRPGGEISLETNKLIEEAFNSGAVAINYTGHGGERLWAQEKIFDDLTISRLENKRLPLLVTATCEFGRQDDPALISGAELCMLRKEGGAISLVTTSRPVNAATNFLLNEAFYNAFFQKENNRYLTLGEIFRRTKNNSISGVSNRNFSLIGDPSLHLVMPPDSIKITQVTTASGSSTLKALSTVTVKGEVVNANGETISAFNGIVEATLFDKETSFITLGNENQPYPYKQWFNALFRGKATVKDGVFEFQFVVPKNIAYQVNEGKLSLYAYDTLNKAEATGFSQDFDIGSSELSPEVDLTPPTLTLFMGDTTFINGGITNPNTTLMARLFDQHGINISGYGIGNSIIGTLDDSQTYILNDFYEADLDDFTRGTISFPMTDLAPGKHTITVKAWDTYNNPVQAIVTFTVTDGESLIIESFGNFPNPFKTSTTLFFTHNRSGDDLQASLVLYDFTGRVIETREINIPQSGYHVELASISWNIDGEKKQPTGLYFARLVVRSLANGSKNEQVTKLIMSN